jgi:hypothetical protein
MVDSAGPEPADDDLGTTLTVDELILRPWRQDDAPALYLACQDPDIARWVTIPQPYLRRRGPIHRGTMWRYRSSTVVIDAATG